MGITDPDQICALELGVTLYGIGKIGMPDAILLKPGPLTLEERQEIEKHTDYGYDVLKNSPFLADPIVPHHHE